MEEKLSPRRRLYDRGMRGLVWLCAGLTCALLLFLIGYIFYRGVPGITWSLLTSQTSYIKDTVGVLPNILNTLYIIVAAMVIVLPLGVGAAIYLTEYAANRRLVAVIEFATETLTGIPSIIFGLVGMLLFVQRLGLKAGILAGGLALVVLFTLANTNVSERIREMATLKVLGFYDREVHNYVNREMMILTGMGVVVGLPLGRWIGGLLTAALNMPSLYFEVEVHWYSYAIAVVATLAFALLVQLFTNPVLDRVDPVSSLKSVE